MRKIYGEKHQALINLMESLSITDDEMKDFEDLEFEDPQDKVEMVQAMEEYRQSDEVRLWHVSDETCHNHGVVEAETAEAALALSRNLELDGAYDEIVEEQGTIWVDFSVKCWLTGEEDEDRVTIHPDPPQCTAKRGHKWVPDDSECKENPGVFGHVGGVIIYAHCKYCGCKKVTDTWAQNMSTGEQGLESICY